MPGEIVAFDTSVLVSALHDRMEHHGAARAFVARIRAEGQVVLPLPALIETWSVLTRLPPALRLRGRDAHDLLAGNLRDRARVVALDGHEGWDLVDRAAAANTIGGAAFDLHIAACAEKAGASCIATFNRQHFERFELGTLRIVVPLPP